MKHSLGTVVLGVVVMVLGAAASCGGGGSGTPGGMGGGGGGGGDGRPVILSFTASPPSLAAAGQSTLRWQVLNATSLSIDHGVGAVSGESAGVTVSATTIYTLTATNSRGSTEATTAVVIGQNPSSSQGRRVMIISPTGGESFIAPSSLRLVAFGYDQTIDTNEPAPGLGNNASKVQFFVDDDVALEVDGANAEFSIFKGYASDVATGQRRVWARAIYTNPALVLDSAPVLVTVSAPPAYGRTLVLDGDLVISGSAGYELSGTADSRVKIEGSGHRITGSGSGPVTFKYVDFFDVGSRTDLAQTGVDVTTSGTLTVEDCAFDASNTVRFSLGGTAAASVRRNLFRSNMRNPLGQFPEGADSGGSYPVAVFGGASTGAKSFAGNNVGAGWIEFNNVRGWVVGGDSDADSNVLIGPRVGIHPSGEVQVRRNFSHHVYRGGWSQGNNFDLGEGSGVVVEHNVIYGSSWPVRGVGGEFRYNMVVEAGHQWLWASNDNASVHHNLFIGGDADIGGIYILYDPMNVRIFNNTIDGVSGIGLAVLMTGGMASLTSNLFVNAPSPTVTIMGGTMTADYNLFSAPATAYSDSRAPAHDKKADPMLTELPTTEFDLDEVGIWKRNITVRDVLTRYRMRYTPKAGSPAIDAGDPAGGAGNDIGAVGAGAANSADLFGMP